MASNSKTSKTMRPTALIAWLLFMTAVLLAPQSTLDRTRESLNSVPSVQAWHDTGLYQRLSNDHTAWHGILFGGLALLAIVQRRRLRWTSVASCLMLLTLYSLATELIQEHFVPGRAFAWSDLLINQIGIVSGLGMGLLARVLPVKNNHSEHMFQQWSEVRGRKSVGERYEN